MYHEYLVSLKITTVFEYYIGLFFSSKNGIKKSHICFPCITCTYI